MPYEQTNIQDSIKPDTENRSGSATVTLPSETPVNPKRCYFIGRSLAFSIGESAIEMAACQHNCVGKCLLDVRKVYIPSSLTDEQKRDQFIASTISDFINDWGGKRSRVTLAIGGHDTACRVFSMPTMKQRDLDAAVSFEVKNQIPFSVDQAVFDHRVTREIEHNGNCRCQVSLFAATRTRVKQCLRPFALAGVEVHAVYHLQDAIGNLLRQLPDFHDNQSYTLMNIGQNQTDISFYRGTTLELWHVSSAGSARLGRSNEDTRFEYFAELLAAEIQNSLDYYTGQYANVFSENILVYGDLSYSDDLLEGLNGQTDFTFLAFPADRLALKTGSGDFDRETLSVSLGSLASAVCDNDLANLLPKEVQQEKRDRKFKNIARVALASLALILIAGWLSMVQETETRKTELDSLNKQIESFQNSEAYHTYHILKRKIARDQSFLDKLTTDPTHFNSLLKELSLLTGKNVKLTNLDFDSKGTDGNLILQGVVTSGDLPPEIILAEYVAGLSASPLYDDVIIVRHVKKKVNNLFKISFVLKLKGLV